MRLATRAMFAGAVAWATVCRGDCEPKIVADDPEDARTLRERATVFLDLLAPEYSVCVPSIRAIHPTGDDPYGRYNTFTRKVEANPDSPFTVYHELCHAVFFQNDLRADEPYWRLEDDGGFAKYERRPEPEAFAVACQFAIPRSALLEPDTCPGDPPGLQMMRDVAPLFTGTDGLANLDRDIVLVETIRAEDQPPTELRWKEDALILVQGTTQMRLDPWNAGPAFFSLALEGEPQPHRAELDGHILRRFAFTLPDGSVAFRRVYEDADGITPLGCVVDGEIAFAYDGLLWSAWYDAGTVVVGWWDVR